MFRSLLLSLALSPLLLSAAVPAEAAKAPSYTYVRVGNAGGAASGGPAAGGESYTIGRDADCRIKLTPTDVSHHHALLYRNAQGDVVIEDTNSTNGTYVNGERVTSRKLRRATA